MDPYVVIFSRNIKYQSAHDDDGHTEPLWNETLNIPIYSYDDDLKISILDSGIIYDEIICSTSMKIEEFNSSHNSELLIPLFHKE
jgi:Ca2+-dependent lipid-binding protein